MKRNVKFFTIVISLLLLSSIILTGCMYAIAADNGEMKPYDLNGQKENSDSSGGNIVEGNAPLAQDSLQAKFEAMYEISEDGKTITVISEDYLNNYWRSNYEKEVIHSLTTEEVYFIIQDSIRIYEEYDEVVLTGFASVSSMMQVAERFPFVTDDVINTKPMDTQYYHEEDMLDIYAIIMYRLTALSSPKAFFTGAESIRFNGGDPALYSSMYPETVFYIPGYSETTDRDYILSIGGGNTNFTDLDRFSDLFAVPAWGGPVIMFSSKTNGSTTRVYPTVEMENKYTQITFSAGEVLSQKVLSDSDKQTIMNILSIKTDNAWISDIPECVWICRFSGAVEVGYCDCGTLSDFVNHRSRKLTNAEKEKIEELIKRYEYNSNEECFDNVIGKVPLHPLYEKYPEYWDVDGMKGVEVYVWQIEDGSYRCGALTGTNRLKTDEEIQALFDNGATIEEMRTILELCEVAKDRVSIIPVSNPLANNWYEIEINDESLLKVQALFWGK